MPTTTRFLDFLSRFSFPGDGARFRLSGRAIRWIALLLSLAFWIVVGWLVFG